MKLHVRLGVGPVRRWHLELLQRLSLLQGVEPSVSLADGDLSSMRGPEWVFALERQLHHRARGLSSRVDPALLHAYVAPSDHVADRTIDLASQPSADQHSWRLEFDGAAGEDAAIAALRSGRSPVVTLVSGADTIVAAVPGSESPGVLVAAFEDLLAGCITVIVSSVTGNVLAAPSTEQFDHDGQTAPALTKHAVKQVVSAAAHLAYRTLYRAPHWRVGWRLHDGPGLIDDFDHPSGGWQDLADDGKRFYADPFPFVHGGETYLFVEDYEHRLGRGVISVVKFDDGGPQGTPVEVLRHEVHLSYPFVLEHQGEVWMIPETSGARTVELYRATGFPERWTKEAVLLDDVEASDATVFWHHDRWWMTATVREGGSFSDALHVWHADQLTGPWCPHANNPVLIDISSARPAGRVVSSDGRLLRPVQDGRAGYGAALALAEVTQLDDHGFEQQVIGRLSPGPWWPGRRLHTLNRAGRLECIDGSAMSPRLWSPRPGDGVR